MIDKCVLLTLESASLSVKFLNVNGKVGNNKKDTRIVESTDQELSPWIRIIRRTESTGNYGRQASNFFALLKVVEQIATREVTLWTLKRIFCVTCVSKRNEQTD